MQHERDPLGRTQRVEDHEQGESYGVGQQSLLRGIALVARLPDPVGNPLPDELLPPRRAGAQHVEAHPGHDRPHQTPYLRAYFGNLGVGDKQLHLVSAELTRAGDVPELARFQGMAADSLAAARAAVTALAA